MEHRQKYRSLTADQFRTHTGREHVIFTGRGAAAIWAALKAFGFSDQHVLIPANTCYIVLWAILLSGNRPMLVDIDPTTGMITPETLTACRIDRPAAIIPCHLYGLPAPMQAITTWAAQHGARVIEDAAQSMVAPESTVGRWGDVSVFSFGTGKIVDVGGRGTLLCSDSVLAQEIRRHLEPLPVCGDQLAVLERQWLSIYWATHQFETENMKVVDLYPALFEIFGPICLCSPVKQSWSDLFHALNQHFDVQSPKTAGFARRVTDAAAYDALCDGDLRTLPRSDDQVLWRYPLIVPQEMRDDLFDYLQAQRLDVTRWYPSLRPMAKALCPGISQPLTPNADYFAAQILNLPLNQDTDPTHRIIEAVIQYRSENRQ